MNKELIAFILLFASAAIVGGVAGAIAQQGELSKSPYFWVMPIWFGLGVIAFTYISIVAYWIVSKLLS